VRKPRAGEGGQILILSLLVVVLLTSALLLIAAALQARMKAVRREAAAVRLTALADAALAETLARLAAHAGAAGLPERPFGEGLIASEVHPAPDDCLTVVARAEYQGRRRIVEARVRPTVLGPVVLDWRVVKRDRDEP
jgi:hypothetical protein